MMTVKDLIDRLNRYSDDTPIKFSTRDGCCGGFPEWSKCRVSEEYELITKPNGDEVDAPNGTILIELTDEIEN